ncbi:Transposase IS66 family protein [Pirellulimonas nuda]|uniref:Transposase IS66 family protein n=1 Tax=Pirellulimonas nuda TaxID=2528009 RepID=A0A518DCB6_9BACT|nr:IS66 family transposase [Pirellulimonas nuda]QDU89115.1 Transposase IS66 family protein [Pirellulimonas nuda]QDU89501.1 Transposase IS66 family protein [Pirellulimonas nuda]
MNVAQLQQENQRLKERLAQLEATAEQFTDQLAQKQRLVASLEHQIKLLLERIRGSRQERIDPDQLLLFSLDELREIAAQLEQPPGDLIEEGPPGRRRKSPGRVGKLPDHLQREVVRHELPEAERACPGCGAQREEIGVESSEQLELVPARLKVVQHDRVKYACRGCQEHVAIADKPPQPIEKGLPGPGLCAHTVLSKFGDHVPLYRQEDIHARLGKTIRRSTLCGWQAALAQLALPLVMRMKHLVLQSQVIHTDDTSIKMLEPGRGVTRTCKFWPYLGDWLHPYAVYDFTTSRERDGPRKFLQGFQGYLQADAYSGYDCIYAGQQVQEVACWVHARRYWHQAQDNDPVRANTALSFIARLSQVEKQLRGACPEKNPQGERDFDAVAAGRRAHATPILDQFKAWLDRESEDQRVLPKSPIRAAFTYTQNQWEALCRYTEQGYLAYDNNTAERLVKLPAIGRKNFLFVGSENGGRGAAAMYSLVSSAKANGVEPFAWLRELFTQLPYRRESEAFAQTRRGQPVTSDGLDDLLPDHWLAANPKHVWKIDEVRRKERKRYE